MHLSRKTTKAAKSSCVISHDIRNNLTWETLEKRRFRHKAIMMYKIQQDHAPICLQNLFSTKKNAYSFRNNDNQLVLGRPRAENLKKAFVLNCGNNFQTT